MSFYAMKTNEPFHSLSQSGVVTFRHLSGPTDEHTLIRRHRKLGEPIETHDIIATIENITCAMEIGALGNELVADLLFAPGATIPNSSVLLESHPERRAQAIGVRAER